MNHAAVFREYCDRMSSVRQSARLMRTEADRQLQQYLEHDERRAAKNLPPEYVVSAQNMSFRCAETGQHFFYDFTEHSIKDQIQALERHTNRQYQWLLVEAYEHFEDFLERTYAAAALSDHGYRPLLDYGTGQAGDIASPSFESLFEKSRSKKGKPYSLLNPLRTKIERIRRIESTNMLNVNLWFMLHLIEKLRHHIVHTRGDIKSREEFISRLLRSCGLFNNGRSDSVYVDWIDEFLRPVGNRHIVYLLERSLGDIGPIKRHINVFEELSNMLLAYAHLITTSFTQVDPMRGGK